MTAERFIAFIVGALFAAIAFRREIKAAIRNSVRTSKSCAEYPAGSAPANLPKLASPSSGGGAFFSDGADNE